VAASFATFERMKSKGVSAFKKGEFAVAKTYLMEAAEAMISIAETAKTAELRKQQEDYARELIDLAKQADKRKDERPRSGGGRSSVKEDEDKGADAADWVVKEKPKISYADVAGMDDVKTEIRMKMIYPFSRPDLAKKYGITQGGGVLLYGPPGTGKTMIAKATASELEATFFVISPAQIMSKWVGEAEQNVQRLFEAAKAEDKSVIFIDEVEALVPKRKSGGPSRMQRVVP